MKQKLLSPWSFFILTFAWTWSFWGLAVLSQRSMGEFPVPLLVALGGVGPMMVGIALTYLTREREYQREYWQRVFDFKRIRPGWLAVTLLTVPVLTTLAVLLNWLAGGTGFSLEPRFQANHWSVLPFAIFTLFFGPIPEELGWRGCALDGLQAKHNPLISSLILGILWTLWHAPLFFIPDSYQSGLIFGTVPFWWYMLDKAFQSVLMTWIYNNTGRSTLTAILFHFMVNFIGELFVLSPRTDLFQIILWALITVIVVILWKPKTLTRTNSN
jgi:membrane protease YdiL (CAAX protease family)